MKNQSNRQDLGILGFIHNLFTDAIDREEEKERKIRAGMQDHDCHLSPEDSCDCQNHYGHVQCGDKACIL